MKKKDRRIGKNSARRTKKWSIFLKLLLFIAFLSFLAIDGYRAVQRFQYWQRNSEIKEGYVQAVDQLRQEQKRLEKEIHDLKSRSLSQERLAREMGYIKPGETVYKLGSYDETGGTR
jgi:cell division protein FtsB